MARMCSVCGKKADTMIQTGNVVGGSVICWKCYEKIKDFSLKRTFSSIEELEENEKKVMEELNENHFPEDVIHDYQMHYAYLKNPQAIQDFEPIMITTTPEFSGYRITEYKGIVSGEVVLGTGMFSGFEAGIADTLGAEASGYGMKVDAAQNEAARRAMKETERKGGNAIVGAKLDLEAFTRDLICVMVSGTAVVIEKEEG